MQSVTNVLLANLASADVLIAVAAVPFQFQAALLQKWVLPDFLCIVAPFVQVLSVNVSIFTLTVISIERYRALLYPFKARLSTSAAGYAVGVIWICAIVCASPMAAALRVELLDDPLSGSGKKKFCFPSGLSSPFNESRRAKDEAVEESTRIFGGYVIFLVMIQFVAPLIIIGFAYINIAVHLWGTDRHPGEYQARSQISAARTKQREKVIKMLILVVALFALCWFPLQAYNFLTAVNPHINLYPYINIVWFCCNFLAMSNSCQNPFILGLCNEKFRQELRAKVSLAYNFCIRDAGSGGGGHNNGSEYSGVGGEPPEITGPQKQQCTHQVVVTGCCSTNIDAKQNYAAAKRSAGKRYAFHTKMPLDSPVHLNHSTANFTNERPNLSRNGSDRYD
ncbi:putative Tachykinin-like peptides receptor 99D [Hypsibius exemplaris]|uniref:Tachykinin-like peptides receptor 99D n=1 Tax=Hypsibius exemplaris TaxID=2072580 RepID=A0A1W0WJY5_HYPEX|nr:putative Tachykinin-like peptides receptor 99D [Hypsibius exemplaris]